MNKHILVRFLSARTEKYLDKRRPKIIAVTGSIGKTSTTQSIAKVLSVKHDVRSTQGSYNGDIGVVLSVFGEQIQTNPFGWLLLSLRIFSKSLFAKPKENIFVLELSPDTPNGMMGHAFLRPDICVVTAVTPEHMEFYDGLDAVAEEELKVTQFSRSLIVNSDMVAAKYINKYCDGVETTTYSIREKADFRGHVDVGAAGIDLSIESAALDLKSVKLPLIGGHSAYMAMAAVIVASRFDMTETEIEAGLSKLEPMPGRMQLLKGKSQSAIIDDTYNASPEAVKAALDTLSQSEASVRIALLGNMNELGVDSERLHREVAEHLDVDKIDYVVTLGPDANRYLADTLEKRGIKVYRTDSPVEAGRLILDFLQPGAVVLAKGSQNRVYAEEAVKLLLENPEDAKRLVRQKDYWLPLKRKQFPEIL